MDKLKEFFKDNKSLKYLVWVVFAYVIYKAVKKRLGIMKVNSEFSTGYTPGVGANGQPNPNIQVLAERLFGLYYNDLTEDEDACVNTIRQVPDVLIGDFNRRYNKLCIERAGNYHWWNGYNHIPTNLISDSQYFLEKNYSKVEYLLNQVS